MDNGTSNGGLGNLFGSEPSAPTPGPAPVAPTGTEAPIGSPPTDPAAQPPAPQPEPPRPPVQTVPLPELLDVRHKYQAERAAREAIERQNAQLLEALQRVQYQQAQPQHQPIDPVAEPERAFALLGQHVQREIQAVREESRQAFLNERLNHSEASARAAARARGNEAVVDQALEAARSSGLTQAFLNQPDPWGAMVSWHQAQLVASQIGNDPAAYEARIRQQERDRIIAEMKQGKQPSNLPPSMSAATNGAAAPVGVPSDKEFFNSMFGRRTKPG